MQFQKSADTHILEDLLGRVEVGQTVTYGELSKAIGRDVREHALAALGTARQGVLRDKSIVFGVERNVGLVRLDDSNIVKSTEADRRHLQRSAKKSLRKLAAVKFDDLPPEQKQQHITASAQIGTIAMFASKNAAKKIAGRINGNASQLAIGETLQMFGGNGE